jgi:hypothetical protein
VTRDLIWLGWLLCAISGAIVGGFVVWLVAC